MSFIDLCLDYRNSLLSNSKFQRFAAAFPLTRPLARSHTRELFDLCAGFVYSQVLSAFIETGLCKSLMQRQQTIEALSEELDLPLQATETLVRAGIALRLAERRSGGRIGAGPLGAVLANNRGISEMIAHHSHLYNDLSDPVGLLRGDAKDTELSNYWPYAKDGPRKALKNGDVTPYCRLMSASQDFIMREVLDAYPFDKHTSVLDIGGGEGVFLCEMARRYPDLELKLFDLPAVAELARQRIKENGIEDRATAVGGDFFSEPLPEGADIITLVRILHDHDDDAVIALLKSAREALGENGTLLIAEPMAGTRGAEASGDAYFGFYLFAMGSGRPRTIEENKALLKESGFGQITPFSTRTPLLTRLLTAKPAV